MQPQPRVLTVSELNREAQVVLTNALGTTWVTGEISNLSRPPSGHIYFTLKDDKAQIRCAFFKSYFFGLSFQPKDGMQVTVRAQVSIYPARGDYQLVVEYMEQAGEGLLKQRFEALKKQLAAEGLFATERKRALPDLPNRIGVITSPTGAAIRDVLTVLKRRFPSIPVMIYATQVQGSEATQQIVKAIQLANQRKECDVLLITRGGGSLEDLWCFNEEAVARAIGASEIPTVSAVGHEVDISISDLVADLRAPTPSAAAEVITPDQWQWQQSLDRLTESLIADMRGYVRHWTQKLQICQHRLIHPREQLKQYQQHLSLLTKRLGQNLNVQLQTQKSSLKNLSQALINSMQSNLEKQHWRLNTVQQQLQLVSPQATLERGYTIVQDEQGGVVKKSTDVKSKQQLNLRMVDGKVAVIVR